MSSSASCIPLIVGFPSSGKADPLSVIELGDLAIISPEELRDLSDRDFFVTFIIADSVQIGLHETMNNIAAVFQNVVSTDNRDLLILDVFFYQIQQQVEAAFLGDLDEAQGQYRGVDASRLKSGKPGGRATHLGNIDVRFWIEAELR